MDLTGPFGILSVADRDTSSLEDLHADYQLERERVALGAGLGAVRDGAATEARQGTEASEKKKTWLEKQELLNNLKLKQPVVPSWLSPAGRAKGKQSSWVNLNSAKMVNHRRVLTAVICGAFLQQLNRWLTGGVRVMS